MPVRRFTDRDGIVWDVWETVPNQPTFVASELATGWLTFSSPSGRRRLTPVPDQWETTSHEQLEQLCRAAQPVPS